MPKSPHSFPVFALSGATLVAAILLAVSCKRDESVVKTASTESDPVAIQVDKREIRLSELQAELDFLTIKHSPMAADRKAFLEPSTERLVALDKALKLGLDKDRELKRQWENLLIGRLEKTEIDDKLAKLTVTDEEIRDFYQRHLATYSSPAQIHLALLFLKFPTHADESAREAICQRMASARELAVKLPAETRGFGADAMTYSEEATSRFKGGDIGWVQAGADRSRWPAEIVAAGFALKENGAVSEPIRTADGVYLLKKLDSREPTVRSLEGRLRATLENAILKEKRADFARQVKDGWKAETTVDVHEDTISKLNFKPASAASATPEPSLPTP